MIRSYFVTLIVMCIGDNMDKWSLVCVSLDFKQGHIVESKDRKPREQVQHSYVSDHTISCLMSEGGSLVSKPISDALVK